MPKKIALVNMPFASVILPSIALTQLRARLEAELGDRVECKLLYLNHDVATYLGLPLYRMMADSVEAVTSGLGDWFFRADVYPDLPDDAETYLRRHFSEHRHQVERLRPFLFDRRRNLGRFLEQLADRHRLDRYDLVGFTSMFTQNLASLAMARRLKARRPEIVTVLGGANCETTMGRVLAKNAQMIDFVFSGPALVSFPRFVEHWLEGRDEELHRIDGVYSRRKLARQLQPSREIGQELDIDVPVPLDYDDFLASFERHVPAGELDPMLMFETSRGCWWGERSHCTFCGLNGMSMKYRSMQPELALATMHDLFARYGRRVRRFQSVDNILPREYLTEVLPRLETPEGASIFYEVKADLKDHEMEAMARAGVTEIQPGVESLNSGTLKLMRKGITSFQNVKFLQRCLVHGINPHWNLLVGFPREEEEVYRKYLEDVPKLVHLPPPSGVYPVRFDRFSPYHNERADYGLELVPAEFYRTIYPFPAEDLAEMAYYFADAQYDAPYISQTARWLRPLREAVDGWRRRWEQGGDGAPVLESRLAPDGTRVVYDSRGERPVAHRLAPEVLAVLDALGERHVKHDRLGERLEEEMPAAALDAAVAELRQRRLLFEERDLVMGVVLERPTAQGYPLIPQGRAVESFTYL